MTLNIAQYTARLNGYGTETKAGDIDHEKANIKQTFLSHPNYQSVKIDDVDANVHILQVSTIQTNPEINMMLSYPDETFTGGAYVLWGTENWLILNDYGNKDIQDKVEIRRCRVELKWDDGVDVKTAWAVDKALSESSHGETNKNHINQLNGNRRFYVQKNSDTEKLYTGQRFIIGNNAYAITLVENVDFPNVLTVYSRYDDVNIAEDDLINDVADNTAPDFSV